MATSRQIVQYQRAQKLIEERLRADLSGVWEKVKNLDSSVASGILQQAVGKLIDKYGLMVGAVAADWFEQLTGERAFVPDSYRVQAWEASVRWAVSDLFQDGGGSVDTIVKRAVFERLSSVAVRHVRQHGRDTIDASVRAVDGVLYARKPSGVTCDFCLMLASRGPVYGTRQDAGGDGNRFHSDCDCVPVPVKGKWQAGRWIGEPAGYDFEKLYDEEYKPYWRENDDIRDVLKRRREVLARTGSGKKQGRPKSNVDSIAPKGGWPYGRGGVDEEKWAKRQAALKSDTSGEFLATHEIEFLEKFEALGHRVTWIPRDVIERKSTNDFIWRDLNSEICELKVTSPKYAAIKSHIQSSVIKSRDNHKVVKDFFIIDLGGKSLSAKLESQLSKYNSRVKDGHIRCLWVMGNNGQIFKEIKLG